MISLRYFWPSPIFTYLEKTSLLLMNPAHSDAQDKDGFGSIPIKWDEVKL